MKPNTKLSADEVENIAVLALNWCKENHGVPKLRKGSLDVIIQETSPNADNIHGEFDWSTGLIFVYTSMANTPEKVIRVVLHEYTHSWQYRSVYKRYQRKYGYLKNPYEIEALEMEDEQWYACFEQLTNS